MSVLISLLTTTDTREMALEQSVAFVKGYAAYQASKKAFKYDVTDDFRVKECKNNGTELYVMLKFSLREYEDGIAYFNENFEKRSKEIVLYCLLTHFLDGDEFKALWLREYEKAVANGVDPRPHLQEQYRKRKESC
jgi:hypothetical protein